jgi:hypothetical protein
MVNFETPSDKGPEINKRIKSTKGYVSDDNSTIPMIKA